MPVSVENLRQSTHVDASFYEFVLLSVRIPGQNCQLNPDGIWTCRGPGRVAVTYVESTLAHVGGEALNQLNIDLEASWIFNLFLFEAAFDVARQRVGFNQHEFVGAASFGVGKKHVNAHTRVREIEPSSWERIDS